MNTSPNGTSIIDQSRLQPLLGWQITRAELHLNRKFILHLAPLSLRPVDFFVLLLIDSNHGINQRQIGDSLGISSPNLVNIMSRLIKKRLIRRTRGRQDRRVQHLYLTQMGHERLYQAESAITEVENELAALIPSRDRSVLQQALHTIIRR